jgi:hypothetical protein
LNFGHDLEHHVLMGVCLFAASGLNFDVDRYLASSPFKPVTVFRKGQIPPNANPQRLPRPDSGFVVLVSETEERGITSQLGQAAEFLARHVNELRRLRECGADNMLLEFGIQTGHRMQQSDYLPPDFINALAALGLGLVFSTVRLPQG